MDFIGILIFFVAIIASIAQKAQEGRKAKEAKDQLSHQRDKRKAVTQPGQSSVRQAKPKGVSTQRPAELSPQTSGKELIKALFGETEDGWTAVEPAPRKELPAHTQKSVRRSQEGGHVREDAVHQREEMERSRADHPAAAHHADKHRSPEQHRRPQQEPSREAVLAERKRRKEQARQHREKASSRQKQQTKQTQQTQQQRRPQRPVAPAARQSFIPQSLSEVRRAIVMAEILGPPKAFEDR